MGVCRTREEMSDVSECEMLDVFGTLGCAYPAINILGSHKIL
jgi:hypothetical protein